MLVWTFLWIVGAQAQDVLGVLPGNPGDALGVVATLGDVDGDGADDFVIGSPGSIGGSGWVSILGSNKELIAAGTLPAPLTGGSFGTTVVNMGDQNGDGLPEVAVGAPLADPSGALPGSGAILLLDSMSGYAMPAYSLSGGGLLGAVAGESLGSIMANVGDIDGDGLDDLALTRTTVTPGPFFPLTVSTDVVEVWSFAGLGQPVLVAGGIGAGVYGSVTSIRRGADYNGLGAPKLLINEGGIGHVYDVLLASDIYTFAFSELGADLGDLDGDGVSDFGLLNGALLTLEAYSGFTGVGIWSTPAPACVAIAPDPCIGEWQPLYEDYTGDGVPELLIGNPGGGFFGPAAGAILPIDGATGAQIGGYLAPAGAPPTFGTQLDVLDVNGDGTREMLVGSPVGSGAAWVISPYPYTPTMTSTGTPCDVFTGGQARATLSTSDLPSIGTTMYLRVSDAAANTAGTLYVGAEVPGGVGAGACLASLDSATAFAVPFTTGPTGQATVSIPIEDDMTWLLETGVVQAIVGSDLTNTYQFQIGA